MKILVTGATGNIGSHLVKVLKQKNADFRAFVRSEEKANELEDQGIEVVRGDLTDQDSLKRAMEGVDRLFLLTPVIPQMGEITHNILNAAKNAGINYIVKVSALGARDDSIVQLGKMHAEAENEIRRMKFDYTFLQPHSFMQNFLGSRETIKNGQFYGTTGETPVPYIDARDVADVAAEVLTHDDYKNEVYLLTGPAAVTGNEVADALGEFLDHPVEYVNVPHEAARENMVGMGFPEWLADDLTIMNKAWAMGRDTSVSKAVERIKGSPGRTIRDFVRDHRSVFQ